MIMNKKSQGEVVSTILIVLLVVVSVGIVYQFISSLINNQMQKTKCVDVANQVTIKNNQQYTCYNASGNETFIQIHFGDQAAKLSGFSVTVGGASSRTYKITNSSNVPDIIMFDGNPNLELPNTDEERTYILNKTLSKPESLTVYPILSDGRLCDASDTLNTIDFCLSA